MADPHAPAYFLEINQGEAVPMGHSYARRALATLRTGRWRQIAVSEDPQQLRDFWQQHRAAYPSAEARIVSNDRDFGTERLSRATPQESPNG